MDKTVMSEHFIYCLSDPSSDELRYVGKSSTGFKRPRQPHSARCGSWIKSLKTRGVDPKIEILEEIEDGEYLKERLNAAERFWIASWRIAGANLTNLTDGGDGLMDPSLETRRKISES